MRRLFLFTEDGLLSIHRFVSALLAVLLLAALPAAAQTAAVPATETTQLEQANADLDKAGAQLNGIRERVDNAKEDDARLVALKVEAETLNRSILAISVATRPRLEAIKARQTELGDPPPEGAPPEADVVKEERQKLAAERNEINALTGEAENLSIDATKLSNRITEIRRQLFTEAILKRTEINTELFAEASGAVMNETATLGRTVTAWLQFVWKFKRMQLLGAVALSLMAALVLLSGSYRLFSPYITRAAQQEKPHYITRLSVAFWSTILPTMAAAAFAGASYFFLDTFNVLRSDIAPLVAIALGVVVAVSFVAQLANAVLSPADGHWRLMRVSDRGAQLLWLCVFSMALVNGADYFLGSISEVLGSPVVLTVVKSFFASLIIGALLVVTAFIRPVLHQGEAPNASGHPWPRSIFVLLILTGLGLIFSSLLGYVGMARFVATQIVVTGAIVVTMYIGFLSGRAVSAPDAFGATTVGKRLQERFGLGPVALDQIGLAAGLAIYLLIFVVFVPLVLLQWGFQVADIESWAYRIFTEIRIGSITISLVGILAGIVLFALGFIVTRWFQKWIDGNVLARSQVDAGVRNSVRTAVGYAGVALAGLVGISAAGINLSSLALVAGALSLGIGFGLQNIVSNFVSGLILLAERPFKVGDWVVAGTTEGFVRRISVRATEIETFQRQTVIVPNSVLINGQVGNWTHRNKLGRIEVAVSVHGGNDPRRIQELLTEVVRNQQGLLRNPEPVIVFLAFSPTTLDFEVRGYLADILNGTGVKSELRSAILERFRAEEIAIGGPAAPEVPIKISPEGAALITSLLEQATEKVGPPAAKRRRTRPQDDPEA
ncbi:mechanosensitive ion channel family protein [Shinella curvata]|uniref:Mechanosensitive ion channel family protein n=1 Tax=Shinella curvata TaxID=1817964 RepID=A0ABT8X821_9HYPH|nr:mechanosensitive ion channel family protein [Shinella curvata]MCJ8052259.1 mechanosensitive ion channel family protein [Shinella curvata]MDO6119792.1 mechanosensitive ion channel family protein [Shinella curvata]